MKHAKKAFILLSCLIITGIIAVPLLQAWAICSMEAENELMYTITTEYGDNFNVVNNSFLMGENYTIRDAANPDRIITGFNKPPSEIEGLLCTDEIRCYAANGCIFYKASDSAVWQGCTVHKTDGRWQLDAGTDPRLIPIIREHLLSAPKAFARFIPYLLQEYPGETEEMLTENILSDYYLFTAYFPDYMYKNNEMKQAAAMLAKGEDGELLSKYGFDRADEENRERIRSAAKEYFKYGGILSSYKELTQTTAAED